MRYLYNHGKPLVHQSNLHLPGERLQGHCAEIPQIGGAARSVTKRLAVTLSRWIM